MMSKKLSTVFEKMQMIRSIPFSFDLPYVIEINCFVEIRVFQSNYNKMSITSLQKRS